jgi:hypothetical protein
MVMTVHNFFALYERELAENRMGRRVDTYRQGLATRLCQSDCHECHRICSAKQKLQCNFHCAVPIVSILFYLFLSLYSVRIFATVLAGLHEDWALLIHQECYKFSPHWRINNQYWTKSLQALVWVAPRLTAVCLWTQRYIQNTGVIYALTRTWNRVFDAWIRLSFMEFHVQLIVTHRVIVLMAQFPGLAQYSGICDHQNPSSDGRAFGRRLV